MKQTESDPKSTEESISKGASSIENVNSKEKPQESAKDSDSSVNLKAVNSRNKIREKWEINPSYSKASENSKQTSKSKSNQNESPSTKVLTDPHYFWSPVCKQYQKI